MAEDLLDHCRLSNKRNDPHGAGTAGTHEWIDFVPLLDQPRPGALGGRWNNVTEFVDG
jgi:hypothetical protein